MGVKRVGGMGVGTLPEAQPPSAASAPTAQRDPGAPLLGVHQRGVGVEGLEVGLPPHLGAPQCPPPPPPPPRRRRRQQQQGVALVVLVVLVVVVLHSHPQLSQQRKGMRH